MTKAHLYINSKGFPVSRHSYSAGDVFNFCAQKYKLARIDGWQEKRQSAAFAFGIALENAVRHYHENGLDLPSAIKCFFGGEKGWDSVKDKELAYTATEVSWDALAASGREMLQLYALRLPSFPISLDPTPRFQVQFNKEVFPGTKLAGIEFVAYVDMIAQKKHGAVSEALKNVIAQPKTKILIDIKTSGVPLDSTPGILALDQQLRTYAWVTDIPDVAFLWFQKVSRGIEKGSVVHLLTDVGMGATGTFKGGSAVWVVQFDEKEPEAGVEEDMIWAVETPQQLDEMKEYIGERPNTKDGKQRKYDWIQKNATYIAARYVTKQRIQFQTAYINQTDREEAATSVGHDIAQIHHAAQENFFPKQGSIRGFNSKCPSCPMLGICTSNNTLRDSLIERKDIQSEFD